MIMTDYFNSVVKESVMCDVIWVPTKRSKASFEHLKGKRWKVLSVSRGKEAKIIFYNEESRYDLLLHYYKGGCMLHVPSGANIEETVTNFDPSIVYERDHRFTIVLENGSRMIHLDQFHQSYWKWIPEKTWSFYRSPDMLFDQNSYRLYLHKYMNHEYFDRPILEVMLHQRFFNGINNLTRSEILGRVSFSPFTPMKDVLRDPYMREEFFDTAKYVLEEIYFAGGSQMGVWKNPFGVKKTKFSKFVKFYKKTDISFRDPLEKVFWIDSKWKHFAKMYKIEHDQKW